ncbi:MAG: GNAT family N-acetyltransferase [Anaerolineae bacterium]|nr:GNAT family N-acetyltransferase [Anaerolineae bacterium]
MATRWWTRPGDDPNEIRGLLNQDRGYAVYALGDLSPGFREYSRWYVAGRGEMPEALILLFDRLDPPVLLCFGPDDGVAVLLDWAPLPDRVHFTGLADHVIVAESRLRFENRTSMWRMTVSADRFQPVENAPDGVRIQRLGMEDISQLRGLYALGGGDAFALYELEQGVFFGGWVGDDLVAAAGTHLVAPTEGVAAVGNVFTHPAYRRRGLAAAVTSAVTAELLAQGLEVGLNVAQANSAAVSLYWRLGYQCYCAFWEGIARPIG